MFTQTGLLSLFDSVPSRNSSAWRLIFFLSPANQVAGLIGSCVTAVLSLEVPSPTSIADPALKGGGMCAGSAV